MLLIRDPSSEPGCWPRWMLCPHALAFAGSPYWGGCLHAPLCCSRTQPELLGLGQGWGCEVGVDDGGVMMLVCQDCCNKALKWGGGRAQTTGTCHLIVGARGWKAKTEVSAGLTSFEDWAGRMCCRLSPWLVLSLCLFTWRSSRIPARLYISPFYKDIG